MSTDWFNDRPLDLREVCARMKEAVEERERFFKLIPAPEYPLEIPPLPVRLDGPGVYGVRLPHQFVYDLVRRIAPLVNNAFDPRNFGFTKLTALIRSLGRFEIDARVIDATNTRHMYLRDKEA